MTPQRWLSAGTRAVALVLALALSACQDSTGPILDGPEFDIVEARTGGNPDAFFHTPLAENPSPDDPNFDEPHPALRPFLRVCVTDGASCLNDVTLAVTGSDVGLAMTYDEGGEFYRANLSTSQFDPDLEYRLEVWLAEFATADRAAWSSVLFPDTEGPFAGDPRFLAAYRDMDNAPSTANCTTSDLFCLIRYGQTIPVKVRLEQFVFCPVSRTCAFQFVAANVDANLEATLGDGSVQLLIPGQDTDFPLGLEPCTAAEVAAFGEFSDVPFFGFCVRTVPPPTGEIEITDPVRLSYCGLALNEEAIEAQLTDPSQTEQVAVAHASTGFDDVIDYMELWPEATPLCDEPTSGGLASAEPTGTLTRLAETGKRLFSMLGPQPLVALDRGGGTSGTGLRSLYGLVLPAKFEYELAGDEFRSAVAGTAVTLRAKVTDLNGDPVWNADVRWRVESSPANGGSVAPPSLRRSGKNGISEVTVIVSAVVGTNVFHAFGRGIADSRETGCTLFDGTPGAASCDGPRPFFDPFLPNAPAPEGVVVVPEGTLLPFTIATCEAKGGRKKCPPGSF